ncbi:hypothetical protein AAFF_G00332260 [Aldrovandia affinis]|uniref:FHA domain-containing protein n=1 Tax=Aldrovandia affinis TaxID=143900 RepID=A0AAD7SLL2_9TELE|nr:hypothetical protein AAFF_G00332260 [Aldrovandia affinis]
MPLHGKIVVIKRSGGDGTEFPLTASCLFGRKPDCDIRIQLPQVSKEHCRIDLNENKEVMLTNLSSVNPTCINGAVMNQAERLKHGDIITIIDRSFRFEYPPEPTPKKRRPSAAGKSETLQVLYDQQVREPVLVTGERRKSSELTSDSSCLKDGTNTSNVQACTVQDCGDAAKEAIGSVLEQSKPSDKESLSPFCELYEMIKQNMKSSWTPSETAQPKTPLSRCEAPKATEAKMRAEELDESTSQDAQHTPLPNNMTEQKRKSSVDCEENKQAEGGFGGKATPKSDKRSGKLHTPKTPAGESSESSLTVNSVSTLPAEGQVEDASQPVVTPSKGTPKKSRRSLQSPAKQSETPSVLEEMRTPTSQKKPQQGTPKKFSAAEVVEEILSENVVEETCQTTEKSETPKGRRSKESRSTVLPCLISDSVTPGRPSGFQSPDIPDALNLKQAQIEEEAEISKEIQAKKSPKTKKAASPQRVSPRKSPGKHLQAPDVLLELEFAAPPSGGKAVNAGNPPRSGKKRRSEKLESDLPTPRLKRKRVSFGTQLSPELFDKRLPPNSPLRKGSTPGRRGLSFLKLSTVGLMEETGAEMLSPKSKSAQHSPGKKASKSVPSVNGTPLSAKKSPKKVKTPSPKKPEARGSPGPKSPASAKTPSPARPRSTKEPMTPKGKKSLTPRMKTPSPAPSTGKTPAKVESSCTPRGKKSPLASAKTPPSLPADTESPSPAMSARRGRRSVSDVSKTPSPVQSTAEASVTPLSVQMASSSTAKTPSPRGMSFDDGSSNQTPTVRGRFSVSRISTPSPVADQDTGAAGMSEHVTPCVPLRRKSMKSTSKKTPKSTRKSILEVIRSRRSGASRANFKVVSSWADIVKFGVSKPQAGVPTKKRAAKTATVKKVVVKKPKTPAKKVQAHFSTGHAASPVTIVVGKAHIKVSQAAGCAPKLVHNIALLRKDMKINEDLTGIAEIFRTPSNVREKKIQTSVIFCPETPKAATTSFTEDSVMDTPEEIGEMVVSPLSVTSTAEHGKYNSEAVTRLLQEDQDSSLIGVDSPQGSVDTLTASLVPAERAEKQDPVLKRTRTPKQKPEPLICLTGVKRLLKTPKEPKVSREVSLVGVKEILKTPKPPKGQAVEDLVGVQRIMKTPKQKVVPVQHLTGVKRLMKTPKEKGQPVESKFGLKRLMHIPKRKVEHVEDLTGVRQLMQTPKQKGKPVERKFGISKLMKSPRQRGGAAVEDFAGLQELMEEPADYLVAEVCVNKGHETSEEKISETCVSLEVGESLSAPAETEMAFKEDSIEAMHEENQSNATKKSVRGRPQKQVENCFVAETKDCDSVDSEVVVEIDNAGDADQNTPDVKSKRGRMARQVAAPPVKRTRQKITEIKEEAVNSAVAAPTKSTRGRRARNAEGSEKGTVEDKPCGSVESDEVKSMAVEILSIAEPTAPVQVPAKGRRGKKIDEVPQSVPAPTPVRKPGRGRKAKVTDSTVSDESIKVEMPPTPKKAEDAPEKISSPVPVVTPRRVRKPKQLDDGHVTATQAAESVVSETAESDIGSRMPETEEQPPVKSGRGRKTKAAVKEDQTSLEVATKRTRRGAIDLVVQTAVSSPIPAIKSGRGRGRKAQNLEEVIPLQADTLSTECSTEPPRKTRGKGKPPKIPDSVADDVACPAPVDSEGGDCLPENSLSSDVVKNARGKTSRRGKVVSQKAGVDEADKKDDLTTSDVKAVKRTLSKKAVSWSSHLALSQTTESGELASPVGGSPQRKLEKSEEPTVGFAENAGNSAVETDANLVEQTKSRRGRAGKKSTVQPTESSLVTEHRDPEPCTGKAPSTRRGRTPAAKPISNPAKQDAPVAKRGMKRKATPEDVNEVTGDNEPASESVKLDSLPKRVRRGAAKTEETKGEASTASKIKRGSAKKAVKALENEVEETGPKPVEPKQVETPKPAGRGGESQSSKQK